MFSLLDLQSYSIYEHTTNSSNTLRYFSIRIEDQNKSVNKKDRDRRRQRYKRGKVYGGKVEEEEEEDEHDEQDEHEAHKPARVFDEPLKKP
jgi:hypothetical protein